MVKFIESELVSLKKEVNEMWTLVYNQLDRAGEAVLTFNRDQAQQVIVREKRVNAFELKIDSDVEDTIALYNPVAIDLRFVLAMFKINSDLERLGDFAEGIARFVVRSEETVLDSELLHSLRIEEMLFDIFTCETDLRIHCQVEDDIFVPAVEILEEKVGVQQNDAPAEEEEKRPEDTLSEREREIVHCVVCGLSNKQIAEQLFISLNTVLTHRKNIARKLNIHSVAGLTIYAIVNKIVNIDELQNK